MSRKGAPWALTLWHSRACMSNINIMILNLNLGPLECTTLPCRNEPGHQCGSQSAPPGWSLWPRTRNLRQSRQPPDFSVWIWRPSARPRSSRWQGGWGLASGELVDLERSGENSPRITFLLSTMEISEKQAQANFILCSAMIRVPCSDLHEAWMSFSNYCLRELRERRQLVFRD